MQKNMDMVIEESEDKKNADIEWKALLAEHTKRFVERSRELKTQGAHVHLDGGDYFKDIDEWFYAELDKLKKKYNIL